MKKMPGRNTITFLIVGNLGVYIMETMLLKSYGYQKAKIEYYGADSWTVLSHITLPICIFYRCILHPHQLLQLRPPGQVPLSRGLGRHLEFGLQAAGEPALTRRCRSYYHYMHYTP